MRVLCVLQARMSSSRLPGKVLAQILGKPMLAWQIERIKRSSLIDQIVVATSMQIEDNAIVDLARTSKVKYYQGALQNVLLRFYEVARRYQPCHVVRLTGDCPLIDPNIIDEVINMHFVSNNDYTSNCLSPTYPDGMDVEVMTYAGLLKAYKYARLPSELEHVTRYINQRPKMFRIGHVAFNEDASKYRLTVDEKEDLILIRWIYETLYPTCAAFTLQDILELLKANPDMVRLNQKYKRNAGMAKTLLLDKGVQI